MITEAEPRLSWEESLALSSAPKEKACSRKQ